MTRIVISGASYAFAMPDEGWGALLPFSITTSEGPVSLPGEAVLALVGTRYKGKLLMAGQGHLTGSCWLWDGTRWSVVSATFGVSPCAFGDGVLYVATSGATVLRLDLSTGEVTRRPLTIGSQGLRYVDGDTPVSGDATFRKGDLFQYTVRGDAIAGQLDSGAGLNGHLLDAGDRQFIRFARTGDRLALGMWDQPGNRAVLYWMTVADIAALPWPPVPIVAIGRALWLGWFVFPPADGLPSNCALMVPDPIIRREGHAVAHYVAAEADGTLAGLQLAIGRAAAERPDVPVLAYWPMGLQTGQPPVTDYVGIEAYQLKSETLAAFEARIRAAVAKCPHAWLICQGYTQPEPSLQTTDLAALVPVYARIAKDCPKVAGLLVFSAGSRRGGWADHLEIQLLWEQFASGITGTPALPMPIPPTPVKPPPTPKPPPKPPAPATRFPRAVRFSGGPVKVYAKLNGKYIGVDPTVPTPTIYHDRTSGGAWEEIDLQPVGDGTFTARFIASDKQLSITSEGLQLRPAGTHGEWETFRAATQPGDNLSLLYRTDGGRLVQVLTLEEAA